MRRVCGLAVGIGFLLAVAGAGAATVKLPAKVVIKSQAIPGPNDPGRCVAVSFAQFPVIAGATSYSVHVDGFNGSSDVSGGGPPFPYDTYSDFPALFRVPSGSHWFPLGSSSTGTGCGDAEASQAGRFAIASATATVPNPPKKPEKKEPKKASISVAVQLGNELGIGDNADAKVTVKAGEEALSGVHFTGDALRVVGKAVKIVEEPKVPASFSLGAGGSRSFVYQVKGVEKGTSSLRSSVQGNGPDGPVSAATNVDVKVGDAELLIQLATTVPKPEGAKGKGSAPAPKPGSTPVLALDVDDNGKVSPGKVEVEVTLKNTTKKPLKNVRLTGLFPQPAEDGSTPDQLALDKKLLPVAVGTVLPGKPVKRTFPLVVTGDGEYKIRALATYAETSQSPTRPATGVGGRFEATVPPLYFEARLETSGQLPKSQIPKGANGKSAGGAWVKAGGTVLITGKVKNLSSVKTLCLAPLDAKRTGNAGGTGPVDIARFKHDDPVGPPAAGLIKPRDDVLIGLWVHTVVGGSPRATIEFAPKAGTVAPNGKCLADKPLASPLDPKQIKVKPGSTEFEIHVDVRDPVFSTTLAEVLVEYYGGQIGGAAKAAADFLSGTAASVAESLSPANLAKLALDPLGFTRAWGTAIKAAEFIAFYWDTASPEERNLFIRAVKTAVAAGGDAYTGVRDRVDGVVGPWMNQLVVSYYKGDYKTVARTFGEAHGYVGETVALNIAMAEIGNRMIAELPRLSAAFKEIGDTTRTYKALRALPPGKLLNLTELRNLYGVAAEDLKKLADIAEKYGVRIGVKGRSAEALAELKRGSVWKPEPVKPKNVNQIDQDWLGFKTRRGRVAVKKFTPEEVQAIRKRIAESNLSFEQKQAVIARLGTRLGEEKYLAELKQFKNRGEINVGKNYRDNGFSPEDAPFVSEKRKFGLETTPSSPGEFNPKMAKAGSNKLEWITGDIDGLYIMATGGHALDAATHLKILKELWETGWQHPETLTWILKGDFEFAKKAEIFAEHALGGQAAMEIGPDRVARAVFVDIGKSLLFDPRAFWLDVIGGFGYDASRYAIR